MWVSDLARVSSVAPTGTSPAVSVAMSPAASLTSSLAASLAGLPAVTTLAEAIPPHERTIPIEPALSSLFPDAGLRRGHVVSCRGPAARSLALALVALPAAGGAWVAMVGLPDLGVEAAVEHGLPPERLVSVDARSTSEWADRLVAAADGIDLLLTTPPADADRVVRKLRQRIQAKGSVVVFVPAGHGPAHPVAPMSGVDVDLITTGASWIGIGEGHGRLTARRVTIRAGGRRLPRPVTIECWLPGPDGRVDVVQTGTVDLGLGLDGDPGGDRDGETDVRRERAS